MNEPCKHTRFSYETISATGSRINLGIVRCSQCGTAIGAFIPQVPEALNIISEKLDDIKKDIHKLTS